MRKKYVYICSPFRGTAQQQARRLSGILSEGVKKSIRRSIRAENSQRAKRICKAIVSKYPDIIPIAPHLYFPQFLSDELPEERDAGLEMGLALLSKCSELWLFDSDGIGEGMTAELRYAAFHGIKIRKINEETLLEEWRGVLL